MSRTWMSMLMVALLATCLSLATATASDVTPLRWNSHDRSFKLVSSDSLQGAARFEVSAQVKGRLMLRFGPGAKGTSGSIRDRAFLYAKLTNIDKTTDYFPEVVSDSRPAPVRVLDITGFQSILNQILSDKERDAWQAEDLLNVHFDVEITVNGFSTDIACDSRHYWVTINGIRRLDARESLRIAKSIPERLGC